VQPFTADFGLTFKPGEVVVCERLEPWVLAGHDHTLDRLGKQKLMMERNKAAFIPQ
jgi:hypothetical protein